MTRSLTVLLGGERAGTLTQGDGGALTFAYEPTYRQSPTNVPLSVSMPPADATHTDPVVRAFCQGLLPDNEGVLERWGRDFHVSAGNPFALLSHVGEDCAGAVQFVAPGRVEALLANEGEVGRFVDALALNWLIAGTDAHAKNYSLLLTPRQIRLAPLYDVASSLPYDDMYLPRLRLAMKIGSEYRVSVIGGRHWIAFAEQNGLDPDRTIVRIDELARRLPDAFREAAAAEAVVALGSALPGRLAAMVGEHAERCRKALQVT